MLSHELVVCRHAENVGDAYRWIADQPQRLARIERAGDHYCSAGLEHRIGEHVEPAAMEQREHPEEHRRALDADRGHAMHGVPEIHTMRNDRALGQPCCAGGVKNGRGIVQGHRRRLVQPGSVEGDPLERRAE